MHPLPGVDFDHGDRQWAAERVLATELVEHAPDRLTEPRPTHAQALVRNAGVLRVTLQVLPQRRAIAFARGEFKLLPRALRQGFAELAIKSSDFAKPVMTWPRNHWRLGSS